MNPLTGALVYGADAVAGRGGGGGGGSTLVKCTSSGGAAGSVMAARPVATMAAVINNAWITTDTTEPPVRRVRMARDSRSWLNMRPPAEQEGNEFGRDVRSTPVSTTVMNPRYRPHYAMIMHV